MAKSRPAFVCQSCSARFPKWLGRCPDCGGWNSVVEEPPAGPASVLAYPGRTAATRLAEAARQGFARALPPSLKGAAAPLPKGL
jgi:predicted ATP-dependent serine protease